MEGMAVTNGRSVVMSRCSYRRRMARLRAQFPWIRPFHLAPAPGHLSILRGLLLELTAVVPADLLDRLNALYVAESEGRFMVTMALSADGVVWDDAVNVIAQRARELARHVCAVCGVRAFRSSQRGNGFCDMHCDTRGRFKHEFLEIERQTKPAGVIDSLIARANESPADKEVPDGDDPIVERETLSGPVVSLVDMKEARRFCKSQSGRNGPRFETILKRIEAAGSGVRSLGVLPESWMALIDEFDTSFPNFATFTEFLRDQFALSALGDGRITLPPVLFVGPPGVGKTEAASWLAERLGLPFRHMDFSLAQTSAALVGLDAFWSNTHEGALFEVLAYDRWANPIFVLDELDKTGGDGRFDPMASLYSLLEPRSAERFVDLSIREFAVNARYVNWIATANGVERLPEPIRSRFTILTIPLPTPDQSERIAQAIYARMRTQSAWGQRFPETLAREVRARFRSVSPRAIRQSIERALGAAARARRCVIQIDDVPSKVPMPSIEMPPLTLTRH